MSLQDVRNVLHEIVAATAGGGVAERLHGLIDGLGAPAPSYAPSGEPEPAADPAPAEPEAAAEPAPDVAEPAAPAAPEQPWTAF